MKMSFSLNLVKDNFGIFNSLLIFRMDAGDLKLHDHLENSKKNAIHTTDGSQNELLGISGQSIKDTILEEVQQSKYFSVLGDETVDISNQE
jgi:hypothetical protein